MGLRSSFLHAHPLHIRYHRLKQGLSQSELARLAGCRTETVGEIERGLSGGSPKTLVALARALNVAVSDISNLDEMLTSPDGANIREDLDVERSAVNDSR